MSCKFCGKEANSHLVDTGFLSVAEAKLVEKIIKDNPKICIRCVGIRLNLAEAAAKSK